MIENDSTPSVGKTLPVDGHNSTSASGGPFYITDELSELVSLVSYLEDSITSLGEFRASTDVRVKEGICLVLGDMKKRSEGLLRGVQTQIADSVRNRRVQSEIETEPELDVGSDSAEVEGQESPTQKDTPSEDIDLTVFENDKLHPSVQLPRESDRQLWWGNTDTRLGDAVNYLEEIDYFFHKLLEALFEADEVRESMDWELAKCGLIQWKDWMRLRRSQLGQIADKEIAKAKRNH
ncbi:hypothetical protein ACVBEJ_14085 [Porticoccus sp. GXU_MW_L64]